MYKSWMAAALVAVVAAPSTAQTAEDFAAKVINAPMPGSLQVYGIPKPPLTRSKDVDGGKVLKLSIPGADKNPWNIQLQSPTTAPVAKGDRLVLAFHVRATGLPAGTKAKIASAGIQLNKEPYSQVIGGPIEVGEAFEFHQVAGKADRDYAAGELMASLQLATGKQVFEFGPLFVINLDKK